MYIKSTPNRLLEEGTMNITKILRTIVLSVGLTSIAGVVLAQGTTAGKDLKGCDILDVKPADPAYVEVTVHRPRVGNNPHHAAGLPIGVEVSGVDGVDRSDVGRPNAKVETVYKCKLGDASYILFRTKLTDVTDTHEVTTVLFPPTATKGTIVSCSPAAKAAAPTTTGCFFGHFTGDAKVPVILKPLAPPAPPAKPASDTPKKG